MFNNPRRLEPEQLSGLLSYFSQEQTRAQVQKVVEQLVAYDKNFRKEVTESIRFLSSRGPNPKADRLNALLNTSSMRQAESEVGETQARKMAEAHRAAYDTYHKLRSQLQSGKVSADAHQARR